MTDIRYGDFFAVEKEMENAGVPLLHVIAQMEKHIDGIKQLLPFQCADDVKHRALEEGNAYLAELREKFAQEQIRSGI